MNILIRVDASEEIGSGHLMRCLTLADEGSKRGCNVFFVMRNAKKQIVKYLKSRGYGLKNLEQPKIKNNADPDSKYSDWLGVGQEEDAEETKIAVKNFVADWVVVDHYGLNAEWHRTIKTRCSKLMVIDDLVDRGFDCELLLNQCI